MSLCRSYTKVKCKWEIVIVKISRPDTALHRRNGTDDLSSSK